MPITLALGTDHRGFLLKQFLLQQTQFNNEPIVWLDLGCYSLERTDYPLYAHAVVKALYEKKAQMGILLCANGVGMSIAANRFKGIYAALAWNPLIAQTSREDDNSNILCLPSDYITEHETILVISTWLKGMFKKGRYGERLNMIDEYTQTY